MRGFFFAQDLGFETWGLGRGIWDVRFGMPKVRTS
jgi:hypothetical protein